LVTRTTSLIFKLAESSKDISNTLGMSFTGNKQALKGHVHGKRSRRRPKRRWLDGIKEDVESVNMTIQDATKTALAEQDILAPPFGRRDTSAPKCSMPCARPSNMEKDPE